MKRLLLRRRRKRAAYQAKFIGAGFHACRVFCLPTGDRLYHCPDLGRGEVGPRPNHRIAQSA
jgi:hypothetical protein